MELPTIGSIKELNPQVLEDHRIVAIFGICNNTLCVQDHALDRYVSRVHSDQAKKPILEQLYYLLSASLVVKRKNEAKQTAKHGSCKAIYRFEEGWIFVLTWIEQFGFWLLKTVYHKEEGQLRVYDIKNTRAAIRASAWSPISA